MAFSSGSVLGLFACLLLTGEWSASASFLAHAALAGPAPAVEGVAASRGLSSNPRKRANRRCRWRAYHAWRALSRVRRARVPSTADLLLLRIPRSFPVRAKPEDVRWPARIAGGPGATRRAGPARPSRRDSPNVTEPRGRPETGRPIGGTAGAPELSRERSAEGVVNDGPGPARIRPAEVVISRAVPNRPDAGGPGRSLRSLSSPADLLSVAAGHRQAGKKLGPVPQRSRPIASSRTDATRPSPGFTAANRRAESVCRR